jgi:hypothetical protein
MNGVKKFGSTNLRMDDAKEYQAKNIAQLIKEWEEIQRKTDDRRAEWYEYKSRSDVSIAILPP